MKTTWMITTAIAALLISTGIGAAQGVNEHGKAAVEKHAQDTHARPKATAEPSGAIKGAVKMDEGANAKGANARESAQEKAGVKAGGKTESAQSEHKTTVEGKGANAPKAAATEHRKSGAAADHDRKAAETNATKDRKAGETTATDHRNAATHRNESSHATTGSASPKDVTLTTEQRTRIRNVVITQHKIPRAGKVDFSISVGTRVPRTVHFYPVPVEIVRIHPDWRSYRVILVGDELVLIDPNTFEFVAVVPV